MFDDFICQDSSGCVLGSSYETNRSTVEDCNARDGDYTGCGVNDWDCVGDTCQIVNKTPDHSMCDNSKYCDGSEYCDVNLGCQSGSQIDCSANDLNPIGNCTWDPDNNPLTWDFFAGFISFCDEATDSCTMPGILKLSHTCNISVCGAECEDWLDCPQKCTQQSHKLYTSVDCIDCTCDYSKYQCVVGECGAECDEDTDCACPTDYCQGATLIDYPDYGYCGTAGSEGCICQVNESVSGQCLPVSIPDDPSCCVATTEVCDGIDNDCDGQIDEGGNMLCDDNVSCTIDICTGFGGCNNTADNSQCDDGNYCNGQETCNPWSGCWAAAPIDCSAFDLNMIDSCLWDPDNISFTWDYFAGFNSSCDEATDSCTTGSISLSHSCSINQCGAECEQITDCTPQLAKDICSYATDCDTCSCVYDNEWCPVPGTINNSICYYGEQNCTDTGCTIQTCVLDGFGVDLCDPVKGCIECVYVDTMIDQFHNGSGSVSLDFPTDYSSNNNAKISHNFSNTVILSATLDATGLPAVITSKAMVDAALVEDISGSMDDDCGLDGIADPMETPCKINDKKAADVNFINTLLDNNGGNMIALVGYSTNVVDSLGLTNNKSLLIDHITAYKAAGTTCISCGIEEGIQLLKNGQNPNRIMVLMSDGKANECIKGFCSLNTAKLEAISKAQEAWQQYNITIHTVAYGSDADTVTMQDIANIANGQYFFADNFNISDIYGQLAQTVVKSYPYNPTMDAGSNGAIEWSYPGKFDVTDSADFTTELNGIIGDCSCPGCSIQGNECVIDLEFFSETQGSILLDNLNITVCSYIELQYQCVDGDSDGFYGFDASLCPIGDDCDDGKGNVNPGASETCDGQDNDCDGQTDEGLVCTQDNGNGGDGNNGGGGRRNGGGGYIPPCREDWECGDWEQCESSGIQARECSDNNGCGTENEKPDTEQECEYETAPTCTTGARLCANSHLMECINGSVWELVEDCEYGCNLSTIECNPESLSSVSMGTEDQLLSTSNGLTGFLAANTGNLYIVLVIVLIALGGSYYWKKRKI
jgi:hypothetical protein